MKFRQGYQTVFKSHNDSYQNDLRAERDSRVEELLRAEEEYIEVHKKVKDMTDEVREFLEASAAEQQQEIEEGEEEEESTQRRTVPLGYSSHVSGVYKNMLGQMEGNADAEELQSQFHAAF